MCVKHGQPLEIDKTITCQVFQAPTDQSHNNCSIINLGRTIIRHYETTSSLVLHGLNSKVNEHIIEIIQ